MDLTVSVSMITYNHGPFIAEALESILGQECDFDFEIVVGEDCSTDDTRDVLEAFANAHPGRIRPILRGENVGSTRNFCETLSSCRGRYIAMMDGDDRMLPGKLQKQADFLDRHPESVMVAHDLREFDSESNETLRIVAPARRRDFYGLRDLLREGSVFGNSSKMFRREALPDPPVDPRIKAIADYYLTLQVVNHHRLGYLQETLGEYRIHPGGLMKTTDGAKVLHDIQLTLDSLTEKYGDEYEADYAHMRAYSYLMSGVDFLKKDETTRARRELLKSLESCWHHTRGQLFYLFLSYLPAPARHSMLRWIGHARS